MVHTITAKRAKKIDSLLDAALELVAEDGLNGLTIARLSKRMQWTKGAMYRYYASKDQLIAALNGRVLARWTTQAELATQGNADPVERVQIVIRLLARLSHDEPHAFGLVALTLADPRNLVRDAEDAVHIPQLLGLITRVTRDIQAAQEQAVFTPDDPLQRALTLIFGVFGVLQLRKLTRFDPAFDTHRLAEQSLQTFLSSWSTP